MHSPAKHGPQAQTHLLPQRPVACESTGRLQDRCAGGCQGKALPHLPGAAGLQTPTLTHTVLGAAAVLQRFCTRSNEMSGGVAPGTADRKHVREHNYRPFDRPGPACPPSSWPSWDPASWDRPQHGFMHTGLHKRGWQAWRVQKSLGQKMLNLQLKQERGCDFVQLRSTDAGAADLQASHWVKAAFILWQPTQ